MTDRSEQLEHAIGLVLLAGSWVSTVLLMAGLVFRVTVGPTGASPVLLHFGLLVLMGTPIVRVIISCVEFFRDRDWLFAAATLTVLVVLGVTMAIAMARAQ